MFNPSVQRRRMPASSNNAAKPTIQRAVREDMTKSANLCFDGKDLGMVCTIRDISVGGARVSVTSSQAIPHEALLMCKSLNLLARAKIVWRKENELGLRFIRRGTMDQESLLRLDQAKAFAKLQHAQTTQQNGAADTFLARQQASQMQNHYNAMGLDSSLDYNPRQLKHRYRQLAMKAHPDAGGCVEKFQLLTDAFNALNAQATP